MRSHLFYQIGITFFAVLCFSTPMAGQENTDTGDRSVDDIARELSNPTAAIGSLNFFPDVKFYTGDLPGTSDQSAFEIGFQPALPKPNLVWGQTLFFRPLFPVLFNPKVYDGDQQGFANAGFNLGDISYDLALGKTSQKGLLYFGGLAGSIPSATDARLRGQWTLGPEIALGKQSTEVVYGALVSQRWSLEGGENKVSVLGGQYFYAFQMGSGHVIGAGPTFAYDWIGKSLTLPLGTGYSHTIKVGNTAFKYGAQIWYYVSQPDAFGPQWLIRLQLTPVVPLPW